MTIKNYGFLSQHYLNCLFAIELFSIPKKRISVNNGKREILIYQETNVDELMEIIGKYQNPEIIKVLRDELLKYTKKEDQEKIEYYMRCGTYHQRKCARFYMLNIPESNI